jgi:pilus assembly protein CpaE
MADTLHILCLSPDPAGAAEVTGVLEQLPGLALSVRAADYQRGLEDLRDPDLVIVVLGLESMVGFTVIEEVHRSLPATRLLALSPVEKPELIVKAMRAGADDLLRLPASANDLLKVCIKASESRRTSTLGQGSGRGELWVAFSAKGGVGVTTLVTNLAFALRAAQRDVALVDLDWHSGDLGVFLNVTPTYTLADIAENFRRLDPVFLQGTMTRHPSGIELLAAPPATRGVAGLELDQEQTRGVLELLRSLHDVVLVDTAAVLSPANQAALLSANRVFLVTELTIPALRTALRTLEWLTDEGVDVATRVEVVAGRSTGKPPEIPVAEAAKTLKVPVRAVLPRDDATAMAAINNGVPLQEVRPGSPLHRAIADLTAAPAAPAPAAGGRRRGLLGLFSTAERGA